MKYVIALVVSFGLTACSPDDAQRTAVKEELKAFVAKCQKNPQDKECVEYADRNSGGGQ